MFTNWLTGTSGTNNHNNNNNNSNNNLLTHNSIENRSNLNSLVARASNSSLLANPAGHILMSTPPDVVLEVGPAPSTVRFVAHSIVLGMHSGYLRSAIRLDEQIFAERTNSSSSSTNSPDFVLFLSNVTAEQFAPLLTYMYTGYLDLNIENIFGVLLATHVLHMPRALEICRAFLSRAQTEGYLGARLAANSNLQTNNHQQTLTNNNNKIIRPIPSKPTMAPFGFITTAAANLTMAPPAAAPAPTSQQHQHQQPTTMPIMLANFKQLQRHTESLYQSQQQHQQQLTNNLIENENEIKQNERAKSEEIDVDQESLKALSENDDKSDKEIIKVHSDENDDEDEEVFIESSDIDNDTDNDEMEVIIEVKPNNKQPKQLKQIKATTSAAITAKSKEEKKQNLKIERNHKKIDNIKKDATNNSSNNRHHQQQQTKRRGQKSRSGLQIAKAPIPASQLDVNEGSKVIIDVASCDGPVRFRRILNTAYGHKPENFTTQMPERSQQSVSYSFHQQMARTIHHQQQQQRQQLQKHNTIGEESENSESSGGGGGVGTTNKHSSKASNQLNSNEIYVCVYCKHTFKSQYCYQKHAKRHLNPLSLNPTERCDKSLNAGAVNLNFNATQFHTNATGVGGNTGGASGLGNGVGAGNGNSNNIGIAGCMPMTLLAAKPTANDLLRREVRPLDMNVQYYPCKTCGSKFPSYYFVHKHRKLCHADEELNASPLEKSKQDSSSTSTNGTDTSTHKTNVEDFTRDPQQSNTTDLADFKTNSSDCNVSNSNINNNTNNCSNNDNTEEHQVKHDNL